MVDQTATVLSVGERGLGKRTEFDEYRITNRGGVGIINMKPGDSACDRESERIYHSLRASLGATSDWEGGDDLAAGFSTTVGGG